MRELKSSERYALTLGEYCEIKHKYVKECKTFEDVQRLAELINKHHHHNFYNEYTISIMGKPKDLLLALVNKTARNMLIDMHDNHVNNDIQLDNDKCIYYFNDDDVNALAKHITKFYNADRYNYDYVEIDKEVFKFQGV